MKYIFCNRLSIHTKTGTSPNQTFLPISFICAIEDTSHLNRIHISNSTSTETKHRQRSQLLSLLRSPNRRQRHQSVTKHGKFQQRRRLQKQICRHACQAISRREYGHSPVTCGCYRAHAKNWKYCFQRNSRRWYLGVSAAGRLYALGSSHLDGPSGSTA